MTARMLVVVLEDGLDPSRVVGIFHRIRQTPGVISVADLSYVDRETLDLMLFKAEPVTNGKPQTKRSKQGTLL
jgi:hypothetical protein